MNDGSCQCVCVCVCVCVCWGEGGILFPGTILCGVGFEMVLRGMFVGLSLTTKEASFIRLKSAIGPQVV